MGTFSSLESGEALLGVATKDPNVECPKDTDAAGTAGAAIATASLLATAAITTIGLSLASSGITAGKAAADQAISAALSGALSSSDAAASDAQSAISAGPGSVANAKLQDAESKIASAQSDAMKLANEKRAGADSKIADAQAQVVNAQKFVTEQTAQTSSLAANAPARMISLTALMSKAALSQAPTPELPSSPNPAPRPTSALPIGIPVSAVAVPTTVSKPPDAISISDPSTVRDSGWSESIPLNYSSQTTYELKQTALSKQTVDACAKQRVTIISELKKLHTLLNDSYTLSVQQEEIMIPKGSKLFVMLSATIGNWKYGIGGMQSLRVHPNTVVRPSDLTADTFKIYREGRLVGLETWSNATQSIIADVYNLECEELSLLSDLGTNYYSEVNSLLIKVFATLGGQSIDNEDKGAILQYLKDLAPIWQRLTELAAKIPAKYWEGHSWPGNVDED